MNATTAAMPEGARPPLNERSCRWCEFPVPPNMGVLVDSRKGESRVLHENPCFWTVAATGNAGLVVVRERPFDERSCDCEPATEAEQDEDFDVDGDASLDRGAS